MTIEAVNRPHQPVEHATPSVEGSVRPTDVDRVFVATMDAENEFKSAIGELAASNAVHEEFVSFETAYLAARSVLETTAANRWEQVESCKPAYHDQAQAMKPLLDSIATYKAHREKVIDLRGSNTLKAARSKIELDEAIRQKADTDAEFSALELAASQNLLDQTGYTQFEFAGLDQQRFRLAVQLATQKHQGNRTAITINTKAIEDTDRIILELGRQLGEIREKVRATLERQRALNDQYLVAEKALHDFSREAYRKSLAPAETVTEPEAIEVVEEPHLQTVDPFETTAISNLAESIDTIEQPNEPPIETTGSNELDEADPDEDTDDEFIGIVAPIGRTQVA